MKKYIIEEYLDGEMWDCYADGFIEADSYEDAVSKYKQILLDSGEFSGEEVEKMKYRAFAETKYILRKDSEDKRYVNKYDKKEDAFKALSYLNGTYCVEEVVINIEGEPMGESKWYFNDEPIYGDDDYETYGNYDGKEIVEE